MIKYETIRYSVLRDDFGIKIYKENKNIRSVVFLYALLIGVVLLLFQNGYLKEVSLTVSIGMLISFAITVAKNKTNLPILTITNDDNIFKDNKIGIGQIKEIKIENRAKFRYNLLAIFMKCSYYVIFILNDGSLIDLNIRFALRRNARRFALIIDNLMKENNTKNRDALIKLYGINPYQVAIFITGLSLMVLSILMTRDFCDQISCYIVRFALLIISIVMSLLGLVGIINPVKVKLRKVQVIISIFGTVVGIIVFYFLVK